MMSGVTRRSSTLGPQGKTAGKSKYRAVAKATTVDACTYPLALTLTLTRSAQLCGPSYPDKPCLHLTVRAALESSKLKLGAIVPVLAQLGVTCGDDLALLPSSAIAELETCTPEGTKKAFAGRRKQFVKVGATASSVAT